MADKLTAAARSAHMARIRGADTKPEWIVRRLLHVAGYRYRLQWKAAPGRPDIAFPGRRKAIFVHGCFWHQHVGCRLAHVPETRRAFWQEKFDRNRARDERDLAKAAELGWDVLVVWECETRNPVSVGERLTAFVGSTRADRGKMA
ncbi:MAG: DNA mismatch endonuclease Vsr [Phenylobacterium sp.]|uniref:very short patch repair endonuclease n=1 Tax=Phenylobacterium sp. TaxID=1871053 RepID=UPI0027363512|nr:DNA mismatch endonuclease Vsr [Phenylobacterium sp.]MDP3749285.1 DNA mismatch endonuclease Vsr [Phenylobacterium sp.]